MKYDAGIAYEEFSETLERILRNGRAVGLSDEAADAVRREAATIHGDLLAIVQVLDSHPNRTKREIGINASHAFFRHLNFMLARLYDLKKVRGENVSKGRDKRHEDKMRLIEAVRKVVESKGRSSVSEKNASLIRGDVLRILGVVENGGKAQWPRDGTIKNALREVKKDSTTSATPKLG
jgi:hypothetical protein